VRNHRIGRRPSDCLPLACLARQYARPRQTTRSRFRRSASPISGASSLLYGQCAARQSARPHRAVEQLVTESVSAP